MSGTGNTRRAAGWMAEAARERGVATLQAPIEIADVNQDVEDSPEQLMGIMMPAHGFTAPWHMIRFALRLPRRKNTHAFVAVTRASVKIGKVFIPGMEGTANFLIALILALKGYHIRGTIGIDMPSNWTALHPAQNEDILRAIENKAKPAADRYINRILDGSPAFSGWICLAIGLAIARISLMYLIMGRFMLAKLFFANTKCNGCGLCAKHCPTGLLRMIGKTNPRPYWSYGCESCMRCMGYCPEKAIEAGHSWIVIVIYVGSLPFANILLNWLEAKLTLAPGSIRGSLSFVLQIGYRLLWIWFAYLIFHALNRAKLFNYLFTYTTFTHLYRRYNEPDTKIWELGKEIRGEEEIAG